MPVADFMASLLGCSHLLGELETNGFLTLELPCVAAHWAALPDRRASKALAACICSLMTMKAPNFAP